MKFSERWLRTLVDPPLASAELQDKLTMAGLEVDAAAPAVPPFTRVVVGEIAAVEPHPDADRLRVCRVRVGEGEPLTIVCGAPNAAAGMRVPVALVGAALPGDVTIRQANVRGQPSQGMLCSPRELGVSDDAGGLWALPGDAPLGADVREALGLDDTLITLKLTPNRADCLSLLGIAREVAAITGAPLRAPDTGAVSIGSERRRRVRIEDALGCPRFASRLIEDVNARAPTPAWMRERLEKSGLRSISAIVDITNYVMLELGQPLHAYDDRELEGDVVVRFARPGETLTLLNGEALELTDDLLLVADEAKSLGLAGIMGGAHSGIGDDTTTVFLEGAYWNPAVIQGRMRRLGFVSDAGYRFERGVDPELPPRAVERATALILEICGGRAGALGDVVSTLPARPAVPLRTSRVARVLGVALPPESIGDIFGRLRLPYRREGERFEVTPPSFRFDLQNEEDLIEEIARIYGFDAIPVTPAPHVQRMLPARETPRSIGTLKRRLAARDWQEVITFSFVNAAREQELFPDRGAAAEPIRVLNPIAAHLDVMRTTLAVGLLDVLRGNLVQREERVRIFESGRCFERADHGEVQPIRIGGLAYGDVAGEQWGAAARRVDFFDVKADLAALVAPRVLTTSRQAHPALHPGRSASVAIDGSAVGWLGELHPRLVKAYELPQAPLLFELDVEGLLGVDLPVGRAVSKMPRVRRDMAIVVDAGVPVQALLGALERDRAPHVEAIRVFDVYAGAGIESGKKSVAILVLMRDTERTLTDAEIDATVDALVAIAVRDFGGTLRQ